MEKDSKAVEFWKDLIDGKIKGYVSVIVLFEIKRLQLKGIVKKKVYTVLEKGIDGLCFIIDITKSLSFLILLYMYIHRQYELDDSVNIQE